MIEIWKPVIGFDKYYEVSNNGNVRRISTPQKTLKQHDRNGYLRVCLSKHHKSSWKSVHRLVAEAFILNLDNKPQVNHKDGNKYNNCVDNLEWCTNIENCRHAVINNKFHKRINKKIIQFDMNGNKIKTWETLADIQKELGIDKRLIWSCCNHKENTKKSKGYIWRYEEE